MKTIFSSTITGKVSFTKILMLLIWITGTVFFWWILKNGFKDPDLWPPEHVIKFAGFLWGGGGIISILAYGINRVSERKHDVETKAIEKGIIMAKKYKNIKGK